MLGIRERASKLQTRNFCTPNPPSWARNVKTHQAKPIPHLQSHRKVTRNPQIRISVNHPRNPNQQTPSSSQKKYLPLPLPHFPISNVPYHQPTAHRRRSRKIHKRTIRNPLPPPPNQRIRRRYREIAQCQGFQGGECRYAGAGAEAGCWWI